MIFLMLFAAFVIYVFIAVGITRVVWGATKKKLYTGLVIAFLFLLPTWDAVLGRIAYHYFCLFHTKVAIYETAETEGIYYEGKHDYIFQPDSNTGKKPDAGLVSVGWIYEGIKKGFKFIESKSNQKPSFIYKCSKPEKALTDRITPVDVAICTIIDKPMSRYMVKVTEIKVGTGGIQAKKIIERTTGKIMGLYRQAIMEAFFPFFNWLDWLNGGPILNCFDSDRYHFFELEVLKPKEKQ